jgi:hypothetical protein
MSHTGSKEMEYEIGCQGILRKHEDPKVKLYASDILTAKMCNTKQDMMGEFGVQSIYRGNPEVRGIILSPPVWEHAIKKVSKYGMRKPSIGLVI